jgi:hypothetical protein
MTKRKLSAAKDNDTRNTALSDAFIKYDEFDMLDGEGKIQNVIGETFDKSHVEDRK